MAVNKIAYPIQLRKNDNQFSHAFGKYYAENVPQKTLSLAGLVARAAFDQSVYSNDIINGVITKLTSVMVEVLTQGIAVKWPGLGTFEPSVRNNKDGISLTDLLAGKWNPVLYLSGVGINFIPENEKDNKLTAPSFKDRCSFETRGVVTMYKETVDGKTERRTNLTPLDAWIKNGGQPTWEQEEPEP